MRKVRQENQKASRIHQQGADPRARRGVLLSTLGPEDGTATSWVVTLPVLQPGNQGNAAVVGSWHLELPSALREPAPRPQVEVAGVGLPSPPVSGPSRLTATGRVVSRAFS